MQYNNGTLRWRLIGGTPALLAVAAIGAILLVAGAALLSPRPAFADHDSTYVICPDPIPEGNSSQMGVRRSGYKIVSAYFFTDHRYHTATSDDYEEYHGVKVEAGDGDKTLWAPIETKEDTSPEHDETFAMGFWDGGVWHHCVITIEDDDAPEILSVNISSSPVDGYAYRTGDSIDVAVDFDSKVDVEGTPLLSLFIGDGAADTTWRGAEYHSGSGTRSLLFRYRVQPQDLDEDGFSVGAAASDEDRSPAYGFAGNIYAAGTDVPINHSQAGVTGTWRQKVDGRPYVQSARITSSPPEEWEAYRANQAIEITLTFDMDVVVEGEVSVDLHLGAVDYISDEDIREATYVRGSGTDTLVFAYTVQPGDMDDEGVGIVLGTLRTGFGGSGAIKAKGADVERNPYYLGTDNQPDHQVDTEPPTVSSVSIVSRPRDGANYKSGERVDIEVLFTEEVTLRGDPHLDLDVGSTTRPTATQALPENTFTESLVFRYEVRSGHYDADGVGIGANSLGVSGVGIYDRAGNAADLCHPTIPADPDQSVEARHQRRT